MAFEEAIEARLRAAEEQNDEWFAAVLASDPSVDPKDVTPTYLSSRLTSLLRENTVLKARQARAGGPSEPEGFSALVRDEIATIRPTDSDESPLELYARMLHELNSVFAMLMPDAQGTTSEGLRAQTVRVAAFAQAIFESWIA